MKEAAVGTGIDIGAAVGYVYLEADSDYEKLVKEEVSILTPEN
jgi:hypothetical protein